MAAKPPIDLTTLLSNAVSRLRLSRAVGDVPNVESARTRALQGRVKGAKPVVKRMPVLRGRLQHAGLRQRRREVARRRRQPRQPDHGGHLCPKGSAIFGLTVNEARWTTVKYRAPHSTEWVDKPLDWALDRIAEKFKATRDQTFVRKGKDGKRLNHTLGIASLGGATFGFEENYLLQKLMKSCGVVSVENQARI